MECGLSLSVQVRAESAHRTDTSAKWAPSMRASSSMHAKEGHKDCGREYSAGETLRFQLKSEEETEKIKDD